MNRLKHVLGTNVSHTVLSQIRTRRHSDLRWTASRAKGAVDFKAIDNGEQRTNSAGSQKRRPKLKTTVGKKTWEKCSEEEHFQNRRRISYEAKKTASQCSNYRQVGKPTNFTKDAGNIETPVIEEEPRSYARMIAAYSEDMYSKNAFAALKDGAGLPMIAKTCPSPFSNPCVISMKPFLSAGPTATCREANFSTETSAVRKDFDNSRGDSVDRVERGENELEKSATYAGIIERYSHTVTLNVDPRAWRSNRMSRRNVSTKFDNEPTTVEELESIVVAAETKEIVASSKKGISDDSDEPKANDNREKREVRRESQTTRDVIKDPRRIATMKDDTDAKSREKSTLQPADEAADWLDKVVSAHKKRIRDRKVASARTPEGANENVEMSGNKPSNPIADYIRRGTAGSNTQGGAGQAPTNNSAQPTAVYDSAKQPQIELRMTPSQNESVVAINVDELAQNAQAGQDRLSVVISSKKNGVATDRATRPDFGSMQISISEDTIPVKQIEFSINGKPVSELKSIVARTDKLDVVGSMDKVEIRIPPKDNNARMRNQQQATKSAAHPSAVLNLHINAKFNEPRVQQPKSTGVKRDPTPVTPRVVPPNQSSVPPRSYNVSSSSSQNEPVSKFDDTVVNVEGREERPKNLSQINPTEVFQTGASRMSTNLVGNRDKAVSQNVNTGGSRPPRNSQDTRVNPEKPRRDGSTRNREPSNMIPWWSSEEPFNNIRRKGSGDKDASPALVDVVAEPEIPEAKTERTLQPKNVVIVNPEENPKIVPSEMEADWKKVDEKSSELLDASVVKVTSTQRYVPAKPAMKSSKHTKRRTKVSKKMSRVRSTVKTISKQHFDRPINSVPAPKLVKFEAVTPRRVDVDRVTEAKGAVVKNRTKAEEETKRQKRDVARAEDGNMQRSGVVNGPADLERSANRSAGVSAKSEGKSSDKMRDTVEKVSPAGRPPGKHTIDRRMAEILKTMKPIEKREDGTLIDYGVTVSSRNDGNGVPQVLPVSKNRADRSNIAKLKENVPDQIEILRKPKAAAKMKEVKDDRAKMLEEEKSSSGRKELSKTKDQDKIVDPVKISSVKKETVTEPKIVSKQAKIVEPVKVFSVKKSNVPDDPKSSTYKKQLHQGPKNLTHQPRLDSEYVLSKQWILDAGSEPDKLQHSRAKVQLKDKKTADAPINSDSMKISPTEKTGNRLKLVKPEDSPKPTRESVDKKETTSISSKELEARPSVMAPQNAQPAAKKWRIRSCPPTQRTVDKKPEKTSPGIADKSLKETGAAPFKGTIRQPPSKGNLANFSSVDKEERKTSGPDNAESTRGGPGFGNFIVGPAGLKSSRSFVMHTTTSVDKVSKPASTALQREKKSRDEGKDDIKKPINGEHRQLYLPPNQSERPEKDLLYASWLQRFKNSVDDDKIL
ncbi:uncharacterized protein LOC144478495 [Augochlora pura]